MRIAPRSVLFCTVFAAFSVAGGAEAIAAPTPPATSQVRVALTDTTRASCATRPYEVSGVEHRSVTAPADGYVSVRLDGPSSSDVDLGIVDAATKTVLNGAATLGSDEVATARVRKGQALDLQTCRRSGGADSVGQSVQFIAGGGDGTGTVKLVRVSFRTQNDRDALRSLGLDTTDTPTPGYQDVLLYSAADEAKLKQVNLSYATRVADVLARDKAERQGELRTSRSATGRAVARAKTPGGRTTYRTLPEIEQELKDLAAANPGLVRTFALPGLSIEGRQIMGIEIAENVTNPPDGRPAYIQVGTHHAREWPANEATLEFGRELIDGYKSGNGDLTRIVQGARSYIIPVLNVDGFDKTIQSEGLNPSGNYADPVDSGGTSGDQAIGSGAYKRKNCSDHGNPANEAIPCIARTYTADGSDQSSHPDRGVDPNRNYGVSWGGPGSASSPTDLTYHGPTAFSEPEPRAFADFVRDLQPAVLITNHTFTGLILRPPGTSVNGPAPDEQRLRQLGDAMARETTYLSQFSYQLYDTTGTTDDYIYDGLNGFSYTPEIGKNEFHPPYTEFQTEYDGRDETDDNGNPTGRKLGGLRQAYIYAGLEAIDPGNHSLITGTAPAGSTLTLTKSFTYATDSRPDDDGVQAPDGTFTEPRRSTLVVPSSGRFAWNVNPSSQPRDTEPKAWHLSCTDNSGAAVEKDIYVARGQAVNVDCTNAASLPGAPISAGNAAPACTRPAGFRSVSVRRTAHGLRFGISRITKNPATVDVFRTSLGRRIVIDKRVARFRNVRRSFTWNGRLQSGSRSYVSPGYYYVRFRVLDDRKKIDSRRVVVSKRTKSGAFSVKRGKYTLEATCS